MRTVRHCTVDYGRPLFDATFCAAHRTLMIIP
jgi:hypothetical protein